MVAALATVASRSLASQIASMTSSWGMRLTKTPPKALRTDPPPSRPTLTLTPPPYAPVGPRFSTKDHGLDPGPAPLAVPAYQVRLRIVCQPLAMLAVMYIRQYV